MNNCPYCLQDMNLDTDFMYNRDMFQPDNDGEFECPICSEVVAWRSYEIIEHDFEQKESENE